MNWGDSENFRYNLYQQPLQPLPPAQQPVENVQQSTNVSPSSEKSASPESVHKSVDTSPAQPQAPDVSPKTSILIYISKFLNIQTF